MHFEGLYRYTIFIFIALLIVNVSVGDGDTGDKTNAKNETAVNDGVKADDKKIALNDSLKVPQDVNKPEDIKKTDEKTPNSAKIIKEEKKIENTKEDGVNATLIPLAHPPTLNPGALKRAFYVFVGLSILVVAYFMFRSSRLRKSPAQMVRKYGVLAHKQDIEMRPLPLDEDDDEDTTVFDISALSPQRAHQPQSS